MRYTHLLRFTLICYLPCVNAQNTLAEYQKKVEREEWDDIYSVKSRTPVFVAQGSKEASAILDAFLPIFKKRTPAGAQLIGEIKAFKNWALFAGYAADSKGNQITPKDGIASDTAVLFLKTREGWAVVDYGLGHSDMFYIIWPAQYGVPVELLEPPKAEDDTGQPASRPESKSEAKDKPQPESEGRSR